MPKAKMGNKQFFGAFLRAGVKNIEIPEDIDPGLKQIATDVKEGILEKTEDFEKSPEATDENTIQAEGEEIE